MKNIWVIKVGSQMLIKGGPLLLRHWMEQVYQLKTKYNIKVIWVTSGAIATATKRVLIKKPKLGWKTSQKQALSAVGQPLLMDNYNLALNTSGLTGAQILLTYDDLKNNSRKKNFVNTINELFKWNYLPILNENDAVSFDEIEFGDNDSLSARVAISVKAKKLIILTDVEGLYDKDPNKEQNVNLISYLSKVDSKLLKSVNSSKKSEFGTGGIYSKLKAAQLVQPQKIKTHLVKGDLTNVLISIVKGESVGTQIG